MLTRLGYEVDVAGTGEAGWPDWKNPLIRPPVLMDCNLTQCYGWSYETQPAYMRADPRVAAIIPTHRANGPLARRPLSALRKRPGH